MIIRVSSESVLRWGGHVARCVFGRGGIRLDKREGDGATPAGVFPLRRVLFRPDRMAAPVTGLPAAALDPGLGWCDAPDDPAYNQPVRLPYPGRHERMWRHDTLYDLLAVIGHNDAPVVPGAGSAIFLHIADPDWRPTEGCVALARDDLTALLADCRPGASIAIEP